MYHVPESVGQLMIMYLKVLTESLALI